MSILCSLVGRTADNSGGGYHPYRAPKAASNAMIWNWCIELMQKWKEGGKDITRTPIAIAICPGWVRTQMGGPNARLSVEESVSMMIKVIEDVNRSKQANGLWMYDGKVAEHYAVPDVLKEIFAKIKESKEKASVQVLSQHSLLAASSSVGSKESNHVDKCTVENSRR